MFWGYNGVWFENPGSRCQALNAKDDKNYGLSLTDNFLGSVNVCVYGHVRL